MLSELKFHSSINLELYNDNDSLVGKTVKLKFTQSLLISLDRKGIKLHHVKKTMEATN